MTVPPLHCSTLNLPSRSSYYLAIFFLLPARSCTPPIRSRFDAKSNAFALPYGSWRIHGEETSSPTLILGCPSNSRTWSHDLHSTNPFCKVVIRITIYRYRLAEINRDFSTTAILFFFKLRLRQACLVFAAKLRLYGLYWYLDEILFSVGSNELSSIEFTFYLNLSERELLLYERKSYNGGVNKRLYFLLS